MSGAGPPRSDEVTHIKHESVPIGERLPIVLATRVLRKNLGGPSSRIPPAVFTGTRR